MTLKKLEIELQQWGDDKGRYRVTIEVMENRNEIKLALPPEMGEALINQTKELIRKFSIRAADRLRDELSLAAPPMLEAGEVKP